MGGSESSGGEAVQKRTFDPSEIMNSWCSSSLISGRIDANDPPAGIAANCCSCRRLVIMPSCECMSSRLEINSSTSSSCRVVRLVELGQRREACLCGSKAV